MGGELTTRELDGIGPNGIDGKDAGDTSINDEASREGVVARCGGGIGEIQVPAARFDEGHYTTGRIVGDACSDAQAVVGH